jgi:hypothetical protein
LWRRKRERKRKSGKVWGKIVDRVNGESGRWIWREKSLVSNGRGLVPPCGEGE